MRILLLFFLFIGSNSIAQNQKDEDALMLKKIHEIALSQGKSYDWLKVLCKDAGPRLAGSKAYDNAVLITSDQLKNIPNVKQYNQPVEVNTWLRGSKEVVEVIVDDQTIISLNALTLGNSVGTGIEGKIAEVIEVQSLDEVEKLGKDKVRGKIIFYNRPMENNTIRSFTAYGRAVDQRVYGASKAAEFGAVASIVRSMTPEIDDFPHTGTLVYKEGIPQIPGIAISTKAAVQLSNLLVEHPNLKLLVRNTSKMVGKSNSPNVIGEIKGSKYPEKIILIGGHLDAWDVAQGAHDDGTGCVQSMEVLNLLSSIGYKPNCTIRCVLFSNEESGLAGGNTYAKEAIKNKEFHLAAIESDAGGFSPRGFTFDADTSVLKKYYKKVSQDFLPLLESYGLMFETGGSGADIGPLKPLKGLLVGLRPDSQRYFDYHHTSKDNIEAVNPRELKMGAAAMTSLVYLIDKYGLNE
jgi:carboxypeptidase Q